METSSQRTDLKSGQEQLEGGHDLQAVTESSGCSTEHLCISIGMGFQKPSWLPTTHKYTQTHSLSLSPYCYSNQNTFVLNCYT